MNIQRVEREPQPIVGVEEVLSIGELSAFFGRAFAAAAAELARQGVEAAGPPVALYRGSVAGMVDVIAGFPVGRSLQPSAGLVSGTLPGGHAVETIHTGSYDALTATYAELTEWLTENGLTPAPEMWEEYLLGPDVEADPGRWQTRIVFPVN